MIRCVFSPLHFIPAGYRSAAGRESIPPTVSRFLGRDSSDFNFHRFPRDRDPPPARRSLGPRPSDKYDRRKNSSVSREHRRILIYPVSVSLPLCFDVTQPEHRSRRALSRYPGNFSRNSVMAFEADGSSRAASRWGKRALEKLGTSAETLTTRC